MCFGEHDFTKELFRSKRIKKGKMTTLQSAMWKLTDDQPSCSYTPEEIKELEIYYDANVMGMIRERWDLMHRLMANGWRKGKRR
jgi:hypothetical protein